MKRKYYATGKIAYLDFLLPYWWGGYTRHDVEITPISYIFFSVAMMSSLFFGVINFARKWNLSSPSIARDGLGPHHPQAGRVLWPRRSTLRAIVAPPCTRPGRSWWGHVVPMEMWPEDWEASGGLERLPSWERAVGASLNGRDTYWSAPVRRRSSRNEPNG